MKPGKKIAVIFGTRPDTIKLAPVILELRKEPDLFTVMSIATAQHRQMLDQVIEAFSIPPDYDLNIMQDRQSLAQITSSTVQALDVVLEKERPDLVLVQGDTTTTFVGSLASFYRRIPVGHVEAGLRTNDKAHPFPEEINRRLTSSIADLHFAPTRTAKQALLKENVLPDSIFVTGNTVIDALRLSVRKEHVFSIPQLREIATRRRKIILITMHRRENWGEPMRSASHAIRTLAGMFDDIDVVFPVHLNPAVREVVNPILGTSPNIHLIQPLGYLDFVNLMARSHLILTDSGGVQEEGPSLGKPVLVLRKVTERPEAIKFGTAKLVGLDEKRIVAETGRLLRDTQEYKKMASAANPYGDGRSAKRIVAILKWYFGFTSRRWKEFEPK